MRIIDMLKSQRLATGNVAIFKIRGGFKSKKLGIVKNTAFVIVLLAVFFIMKPVFADTVIVSQLTGSTDKNTCQYCQSFILPTGYTSVTGIDTYISYSAGTADVYVDLKSGSCYGTLIERKTISNPSAGTYKTIYTSATGLTAGNTYYISYSATSCNKKFVAYNTTNVYADGTAYEDGVAQTGDLKFQVYSEIPQTCGNGIIEGTETCDTNSTSTGCSIILNGTSTTGIKNCNTECTGWDQCEYTSTCDSVSTSSYDNRIDWIYFQSLSTTTASGTLTTGTYRSPFLYFTFIIILFFSLVGIFLYYALRRPKWKYLTR